MPPDVPVRFTRGLGTRIDKLKAAILKLEDASAALATSHCRAQQPIIQTDEVVGWVAGALENLWRDSSTG